MTQGEVRSTSDVDMLHESLADRYREIAILSRDLLEAEAKVDAKTSALETIEARLIDKILSDAALPHIPILSRTGFWQRLSFSRQCRALSDSPIFDGKWYLESNPGVANAGLDPAHHFIQHGRAEGRAPSPVFD